MEDFRRFIQKRNLTTSDGKRNEDSKMLPGYSGLDTIERPPFFQSFQTLEDNEDIYDALGQRRSEQTLYYEEEDFIENGQLPNLDELDEPQDYLASTNRAIPDSVVDLNVVDEDKIDQLRKRVRREGAAFTRTSDEFDIKPLARFMLPEEAVKENDIAWDWDSLISDIIVHPDVVELTVESDKDDNDEDSLIGKLRKVS